ELRWVPIRGAVISPQLRTVWRWARDRFDPVHRASSSRRHFMAAKKSRIALKSVRRKVCCRGTELKTT
ncbi:MAG TPA: hypothetical protein VFQ52_03845, partial [Rhizomicrobium sp.]|nr:hypothetical protein [Rhizomicrobium sp.]